MSTSIQQILKDARAHMDKSIDSTRHEFASIRSSKATTNMLDTVRVEVYGTMMSLNQVANVAAPEPRLLTVTPYDKTQIKVIEKAIREAELGLDPVTNGPMIRVPLPQMTEERRKDLVKVVHKFAEEGRVGVRHWRTEARERLKKLEGVSEDDVKHAEKDLQKVHDEYIGKVDALMKSKEHEIMEV
ncbi:MAG TPA: ribosome recycling factor [Gemmatimonadaceae bacterium]